LRKADFIFREDCVTNARGKINAGFEKEMLLRENVQFSVSSQKTGDW
jgi:hypothetical protein